MGYVSVSLLWSYDMSNQLLLLFVLLLFSIGLSIVAYTGILGTTEDVLEKLTIYSEAIV